MIGSNFGINFGDHIHKLLKADDSVSILVGEVDHLVHLGAAEVLADAGSYLLEVLRSEGSVSGNVEGLEDGLKGGLTCRVSSESEDVEEGSEIDVSNVSCIVHDGEDLSCLSFEVECSDGVDQLLSRNVSAAVVIEDIEDFLEFGDGFSIETFLDVFVGVKSLGGRCGGLGLGHKIFLIQQNQQTCHCFSDYQATFQQNISEDR